MIINNNFSNTGYLKAQPTKNNQIKQNQNKSDLSFGIKPSALKKDGQYFIEKTLYILKDLKKEADGRYAYEFHNPKHPLYGKENEVLGGYHGIIKDTIHKDGDLEGVQEYSETLEKNYSNRDSQLLKRYW